MYDEFHEERREITKLARRDNMDDTEISMIRKVLRDQFYERLKYANKPLPALPNGAHATSSTDMKEAGEGDDTESLIHARRKCPD